MRLLNSAFALPGTQMAPDLSNHSTLLLDMDGTLLDLAYDNHFWLEAVPAAYAQSRGLPLARATTEVATLIGRQAGTLNWYCLDFWSDSLGLDIMALKRSCESRIGYLDGAEAFLLRARLAGFRLVLVTNSTRALLELKDEHTGVTDHMDAVYSSHDFRAAKESQAFWQRFAQAEGLDRRECVLIDDSASVLLAARLFGIGGVMGLRQPDSRMPPRELAGLPSVNDVSQLLR
ncbi:MAG: HAD-IA family hydrolase [Pseudomonadota bacterium]